MKFTEKYYLVTGAWTERDGMFLDLCDRHTHEILLWAFYSDIDGSFEFESYNDGISAKVVAWFEEEARRPLPRSPDSELNSH